MTGLAIIAVYQKPHLMGHPSGAPFRLTGCRAYREPPKAGPMPRTYCRLSHRLIDMLSRMDQAEQHITHPHYYYILLSHGESDRGGGSNCDQRSITARGKDSARNRMLKRCGPTGYARGGQWAWFSQMGDILVGFHADGSKRAPCVS